MFKSEKILVKQVDQKDWSVLCAVMAAALLVYVGISAASAEEVGAGGFQFVQGKVKLIDGSGNEQNAFKGMVVNEGDKIVTEKNSSAQVKLKDHGTIAVRPDSTLQIVTYRYRQDSESVIFSLLKGAFRSVTGLIGKKNYDNYSIQTPTATIGIRGTDHETTYVPAEGWSMKPGAEPGTYDTVYSGRTVLSTLGGIIELEKGQTGFAPRGDIMPVRVSVQDRVISPAAVLISQDKNQRAPEATSSYSNKEQALLPYTNFIKKNGLTDYTPEYLKESLNRLNLKPDQITSAKQNPDGSVTFKQPDSNGGTGITGTTPPPPKYSD